MNWQNFPNPSNLIFGMAYGAVMSPSWDPSDFGSQNILEDFVQALAKDTIDHEHLAYVATSSPRAWDVYIKTEKARLGIFEEWDDYRHKSLASFVLVRDTRFLSSDQQMDHKKRILDDLFSKGVDPEKVTPGVGFLERVMCTMTGEQRDRVFSILSDLYIKHKIPLTDASMEALRNNLYSGAKNFLALYERSVLMAAVDEVAQTKPTQGPRRI